MKLRPFVLALGASVLVPASAFAFEYVTVGVGAQFQAGGNFFDKPSDQTINGTPTDPEYPGFAGLTLGGGGYVDVRFIEYVGIEFGVLYTSDKGSAELTITDTSPGAGAGQSKFDIKIKQNAIHMPLLVKGVIPGKIAQPMLFIGPEFVVPVTKCDTGVSGTDFPQCRAEVTRTSGNLNLATDYFINTKKYVMVAFGLGVEFKLPIPKVDIRIPLTLRGAVNPSVSSKRTERENDTFDSSGKALVRVEYITNWKFEANANIGLGIHF